MSALLLVALGGLIMRFNQFVQFFFLQRRCRMLEFVADCLLFVVMGSVGGTTPVDKIYGNALGHHYSESENPMRKMEREKS